MIKYLYSFKVEVLCKSKMKTNSEIWAVFFCKNNSLDPLRFFLARDTDSRPVASGGPPDFGRSVNPISTRGGHIIPTQYYVPPQIFRPCDGPVTYTFSNLRSINEKVSTDFNLYAPAFS